MKKTPVISLFAALMVLSSCGENIPCVCNELTSPDGSPTCPLPTPSALPGIPPVLSNGAPSGTLPQGTTTAVLSFNTDKTASCRFANTPGVAFSSMTNTFSSNLTTQHSKNVPVADGQNYAYYVKCRDSEGNTTSADTLISFTVAIAPPSGDVTILARQYVTQTIHIPGGAYASPYIASTNNAEYILDGDMVANGSAILVRASKVVINLNGKTVTYNQTTPGEGVFIDVYNKSDIAITNGSIIQGAANSEGDQYGKGNNPLRSVGTARAQIANIYARYGGRDVGGLSFSAGDSIVEASTFEDTYSSGILKNRHQGVSAVYLGGYGNIFRNNTIINARQRGIWTRDNDRVHGNTVSVRSIATNSYGIGGYAAKRVKVYDNQITARGEHPIGIGFVSDGTDDIEIYNNTIDVQTTNLGDEYGGNASCFNPATPCGNYAVGFRTTWGGNAIHFHDNVITVHTDSAYAGNYSPTGAPVVVNGKGRGLMVAINAGESALFANNTITTLDKDGTGKAYGIACTGGNASGSSLTFSGNTVTSNILNVAVSDEYGACAGHPLFINNTFIKADNYPVYRTIGAELGGYFEGTARFISNTFQGGAAATNLGMNFQKPNANKSLIFGRMMTGVVRNSSSLPLGEIRVRVVNQYASRESEGISDPGGIVQFIVQDYELHNNNGTSNNATAIRKDFAPHTLELYNLSTSQELFTTVADPAPTAWDSVTSSGPYTLNHANGSIAVTAP